MEMKCKEKSTLKVISNIVSQEKVAQWGNKSQKDYSKLEKYRPVDMWPRAWKNPDYKNQLPSTQQVQWVKNNFMTHVVVDEIEKYPDKEENLQKCADCDFRDICF